MNTALSPYEHAVLSAEDFARIAAERIARDRKAHVDAEQRGRRLYESMRTSAQKAQVVNTVDFALELAAWYCVGVVAAVGIDAVFNLSP